MSDGSNTSEQNAAATEREFRDDLALARQIQLAMVPQSLPRIQGLAMSGMYCPCGAVGGDLYDVVQLSPDLLAFYIFDVSGHGVSAALISAMAKVSFTTHLRANTSPEIILARVNADVLQYVSNNFYITAFVALLDLHSNRLTYCNAGHVYPLVWRRTTGEFIPLRTQGFFLGVFEDGRYENKSIFLQPDDWFFLYTDGLFGLFSDTNEMAGRQHFEDFLAKSGFTAPEQFIAHCRERYNEEHNIAQLDDISAIAVEVQTQSRRNQIKEELGFGPTDPVYLQFISYYEEIDETAANILRDMDEQGWSDDAIRKMKLTITELLANAICHGNEEDHSRKVTVGHVLCDQTITLGIMDEGKGFKPDDVPDPTLPENLTRDHGRGLFIVRNYVDEISFNETANRVLVRKTREGHH